MNFSQNLTSIVFINFFISGKFSDAKSKLFACKLIDWERERESEKTEAI